MTVAVTVSTLAVSEVFTDEGDRLEEVEEEMREVEFNGEEADTEAVADTVPEDVEEFAVPFPIALA